MARQLISMVLLLSALFLAACGKEEAPPDEAKRLGKTVEDFPPCEIDVFAEMDQLPGGKQLELSTAEVRGRNTWILWTAGNDWWWDWLADHSYGLSDFLRILDSRFRKERFDALGLMNEPGMRSNPSRNRFGLFLDEPKEEQDRKELFDARYELYRTRNVDPKVYGYSSGVMGLRLFPNPEFFGADKEAARENWDGTEFHLGNVDADESVLPQGTVRPYRIGMSCGFCHIGVSAYEPAADPAEPEYRNLSSTIGQHWLYVAPIFAPDLWRVERSDWLKEQAAAKQEDPSSKPAYSHEYPLNRYAGDPSKRRNNSYFWQLLLSATWGVLDTSLLPTDSIDNPVVMNPIWELRTRLAISELHAQAEMDDVAVPFPPTGKAKHVPHVLADGSDDVGTWAALARVYLNIGEYGERWRQIHSVMLGLREPEPFRVADCEANSVYWNTTASWMNDMAAFLMKAGTHNRLEDVSPILRSTTALGEIDANKAEEGYRVFLKNCSACHNSAQDYERFPTWIDRVELPEGVVNQNGVAVGFDHDLHGPKLKFRADYLQWIDDTFQGIDAKRFRSLGTLSELKQGDDPDRDNFFSTDERVPVTFVGTNAQRALGTNALRGQMWADFSSETYKALPSVGRIKCWEPLDPNARRDERGTFWYDAPAGGPGYYRIPPLVSVWATAPFLHNNSIGDDKGRAYTNEIYNRDPSIAGRLETFERSMGEMLYPEKRTDWDKGGYIHRTDRLTWVKIPEANVGDLVSGFLGYSLPLNGWGLLALSVLIGGGVLWLGMRKQRRLLRFLGCLVIVLGILGFIADRLLDRDLELGPLPVGTPVSLIANLDPIALRKEAPGLIGEFIHVLREAKQMSTPEEKIKYIGIELWPVMKKLNKAPDFVLNRGHLFGTELSPAEKAALIEFLKTL